ncbi:uncharacterized protein MELLADRAFT_110464 [Melampsora larici-populina 98AG31]|uniref:Helicase C-terminal domain-containing protein n=1 Tax=Melampsora larici-populina (strain 98AG31 / pathotype 3-4-7) TaxID=747676 RepID=F4RZW3_MELLP|nr:uncharacterized protein MELLADRAFT_110464 [Melampsora larici-populina 98AG31]EGG02071.1 hypothetical protein MELLADRAFT_110464 [Melampsora larici-populina 98AG31]
MYFSLRSGSKLDLSLPGVQFGRADAAAVSQIIRQCGRNGKPGLTVFYTEKRRLHGKNSVSDFEGLKEFSDDDLMDGLAVTPVCLRIALTLSNLLIPPLHRLGRIPMSDNKEIYVEEKLQQEKGGMCACHCSNCEPEVCRKLAAQMKWLTMANFKAGLQNPDILPHLEVAAPMASWDTVEDKNAEVDAPMFNQNPQCPPPRRNELIQLADLLTLTVKQHHQRLMTNANQLRPTDYVDDDDIWRAKTLARLQKQHEEQQAKERDARVLKEAKRKRNKIDDVAKKEEKKQRKTKAQQKKDAAAKLKSNQKTQAVVNARMIASLKSGKTMSVSFCSDYMVWSLS